MHPSLRLPSSLLKPTFFLAAFLMLPAGVALQAAESAPAPAPAAKIAAPIVSSDEAVQKTLEKLDQTLEANPKFEEILRQNIDQLAEEGFRQSHPDVDVLLKQQPGIIPALKIERHFLIHRYVARRARGPVLHPDVVALDKFLTAHRDIRAALDQEPAQIMEPGFLIAHPSLADFFNQHPGLSTVLFQKQDSSAERKGK